MSGYSIFLTIIVVAYILFKFISLFTDGKDKKTAKQLANELADAKKELNNIRGIYESSLKHSDDAVNLKDVSGGTRVSGIDKL
jgi:hypothetical protein